MIDDALIPPQWQSVLQRVRDSADIMPVKQTEVVEITLAVLMLSQSLLVKELGATWREHFSSFEMKPIAAASIGQVHHAVLKDGREVAVKLQYPHVADRYIHHANQYNFTM